MRVLAYEVRRLRGLRSTWLILGAVLFCDAAVAAVLTRQLPPGTLSVAATVRSVTAVIPLLPLPIAALGAGALGALSYGHEVRHPGLVAARVSFPRRLSLLVGKVVVIGLMSAVLALTTTLLDVLVLRVAVAPRVDVGSALSLGSQTLAAAGRPLGVFAGLVVMAGLAGLLTASLVRSAAAGILILCALPALLEPALSLILRQVGRSWPVHVRELLPFQYGLDWVRGVEPDSTGAVFDPVLLAVLLAPMAVLLTAGVLVQARRRAL